MVAKLIFNNIFSVYFFYDLYSFVMNIGDHKVIIFVSLGQQKNNICLRFY